MKKKKKQHCTKELLDCASSVSGIKDSHLYGAGGYTIIFHSFFKHNHRLAVIIHNYAV